MSAVWNQLTSKTALLDISGGPTHEEQIIAEFRLPEGEHLLSEIHAEFVLEGSQAAQTTMGGIHAGSLYLTTSYLCFATVDRQSCVAGSPSGRSG